MIAVLKKELKNYFYSVTGALFIAANILFSGLYFSGYNLTAGFPSINATMSSSIVIFLFITPLLTMGIIAQETKQKTDRLLYTSPAPLIGIITGKYLSMLTVFAVPVLVSAVYPLIMSMFGKVNYGECYMAVLAYFLFGAAALSIGLFISSFTENQIISAVLTFAALFGTFLMGLITDLISSEGNLLTRILSWLDMEKRVENLMAGIFDIRAVVYYLCITALMLFLTWENIQRKRFTVSSKTIKLSAYSFSAVLIAIAAALGINYLVLKLPDDMMQHDFTKNGLYTVSTQTEEFIGTIDKDIQILCMSDEKNVDELLKTTLNAYASGSKKVTVKYSDPSKDPQFASKYTDENVSAGDIIVVCGNASRVIPSSDLYETQMDYQTFSQTVTGYDGEGQIASAIAYVTDDDLTKLKYVTGHGEIEPGELSQLNRALKKKNLEMEELNLLSVTEIEDADILFIAAPTTDYSKEDADKVKAYLENGGQAIIATQYSEKVKSFKNFESILKAFGVSVSEGIIVEEAPEGYYGNNPMYLLPQSSWTVMTKTVSDEKRYVFLPYAQAISKDEELPDGVNISDALKTSEASFIKKEIGTGQKAFLKEDGDEEGPFTTAAYITKDNTKIALLACAMALTDDAAAVVGDANVSMVMDAVSAMSKETESVYIPVKKTETEYIIVSRGFVILYSLIFSIAVPVVILIAGIVIWIRRRRK